MQNIKETLSVAWGSTIIQGAVLFREGTTLLKSNIYNEMFCTEWEAGPTYLPSHT